MFEVSEQPDVSCSTSTKQLHSLVSACKSDLFGLVLYIFALQRLAYRSCVLSLLLLLSRLCLWTGATADVAHGHERLYSLRHVGRRCFDLHAPVVQGRLLLAKFCNCCLKVKAQSCNGLSIVSLVIQEDQISPIIS